MTPTLEHMLSEWPQHKGQPIHWVDVRSGSDLDRAMYRLYVKLDLQDGIDIQLWLEDHDVVCGPWISGAQWLGFESESHFMEFVLTWL